MADKTYESDKFVTFTGEDSGWREWSAKVKATDGKKGWLKMIETKISFEEDSEEEAQVKLKQLNNAAFYFLTMSCGEGAFPYVENGEGDAYTAWQNLLNRYYNVDEANLTDLHTAFNECRMESHLTDPTLWFMELELRKMKVVTAGGQKKSEPEMIAFVLGNAPTEYKVATQSAKVSGKLLFKEV
jgi:hypothetical protein